MLWLSGAMLVKPMENLPAVAVSEVLLYFSWPSGLAWRLSGAPRSGALAGAGVEDVAGGDVGATGRAFGFEAGGLGAGVDDVAVLDVLGVAGWLTGVDAVGLAAGTDVVTVLAVAVLAAAALSVVGSRPRSPLWKQGSWCPMSRRNRQARAGRARE